MSITKINSGLPISTKISTLNDQIIELAGQVDDSAFNKQEVDAIYADLGIPRKFLRNVALGNTSGTYTGWTHLQAEAGYSIWKYTPTNYDYNAVNELYLNTKAIINKGLATGETAITFDKVFLYNGSTYGDNTTEAGTELGTEFDLMTAVNNFLYVGSASKFHGIKMELKNKGSNYALKVEYYNGSGWVELTGSGFNLTDNTLDLISDGSITWNTVIDSTWATVAINGQTKYWIRISTTEVPAVVAKAYYIIPTSSVIGLLSLSSAEVLNEEWAWCSYNGSIYMTIRNTGNNYNEGSYYIASASSANNKLNFFVYNNVITINHENSAYAPGIPEYANNAAAVSGGLTIGNLYRTGDALKVVHA